MSDPDFVTDSDTLWRRADSVAEVESPDRFALLNLDRLAAPPMILEGTAAVIWSLLDGPVTATALTGQVAEQFAMPVAEVEQAVAAFLAQLETLGLAVRQ